MQIAQVDPCAQMSLTLTGVNEESKALLSLVQYLRESSKLEMETVTVSEQRTEPSFAFLKLYTV